jgi:hypothetical protein
MEWSVLVCVFVVGMCALDSSTFFLWHGWKRWVHWLCRALPSRAGSHGGTVPDKKKLRIQIEHDILSFFLKQHDILSWFPKSLLWYSSFRPEILEFILEFYRWVVWLSQNWVIISFRKSSKMTPWVNTIPSWDLSFAILVEAIYKFNIELCCHLQFLWQPNKCPFLELQCKWNERMYSFQNATNEMKTWLPNDS